MNIKNTITHAIVILTSLISMQAFAIGISGVSDDCLTNIILGDDNTELTINENFSSTCKSVSRYNYYDPYNPTALNSRYFLIEMQRDADISFEISPTYNTGIYLTKGSNLNGESVNLPYPSNSSITFLTQGFYILELTNKYSSSVSAAFTLLDTNDDVCVKGIELDMLVNDGWHSDCDSNNRDYNDPYGPAHYDSFKAKYFTIELTNNSDLHIQLNSSVDTYVYILAGDNEFSMLLDNTSSNDFFKSLPQGTYTFEVTTQNKYAPGTFSLLIEDVSSDSECTNDMVFDTTIQNSYNQNCSIQSWNTGMEDPYAGKNPERAAYYDFTLDSPSNVTFDIYNTNQDKTVISLYKQGDFTQPIISNNSGNYWSSYLQNTLSKYLVSGDYTLEVTKLNEVAIGSYQFKVSKSDNVNCDKMEFNYESTDLISEQCYSLFREGDNSDPYGPQQGDYYAKRLEFTVDEPTTILISQSNNSAYAANYLAKKIDDDTFEVIATSDSSREYYWNTSKHQSSKHCISPGTYLTEFTTYYPETTDTAYNVIRKINEDNICHYSLAVNSTISTSLDSWSCESEHKNRVYDYSDPYNYTGSNTEYYFSKTFSFYIESDQTITIEVDSMDEKFDMFISKLNDSYSPVLIETSVADSTSTNSISLFLTKGMHQVEVTTQYPSPQFSNKPNFTLTIGDKNAIVEAFDSCSADIDFQFNQDEYTITEGETAEIVISRTDISTNETVKVNIIGDTANAVIDLISDTISFVKGESEKSIQINTIESSTTGSIGNILIQVEGYGTSKIILIDKDALVVETEKEPDNIPDGLHIENPVIEEPAIEEPTIEEPAIEEPTIEGPAIDEPAIDEPAIEDPAIDEPAIENTNNKKSGSIPIISLIVLLSLVLLRRKIA